MDIINNQINESPDDPKFSNELLDADSPKKSDAEKPAKRVRKQATQEQLDNPFHGVKLVQVLERLVAYYGWNYLAERVNIRCFMYNPTMKSSLGFLRKTTWAREHVEDVYLEMLDDQEADKNDTFKKENQ